MGLLTRGCGWLALSSLIAAQAQTAATTTQTSAASANFAYVSDDGCILNEIIVFANRTTAVWDNTPRTTAEVTYTRYRYDYCEDADLGTDLGTSSQPVFSGDLNRASLNATINGHTASGSAVTVSFVLMWEGKGGVTRKAGRPPSAPASSARSIHTETLNRNAVVTGSMDERDISDAAVGASLHTTRKTISQ
jgi:hypothetical protein